VLDQASCDRLLRDGIVTAADFELALAERRPSIAARPSLVDAATDVSASRDPLTLGRATDVLEAFSTRLTHACALVEHVDISGSARRYVQLVSDLALVARSADPEGVVAAVERMPGVTELAFRSARRAVFTFQRHEIDLRVAPPDEFGTVLFTSTGPAQHAAAVIARRGIRLTSSETDVYEHAGLTFLPPELRDRPDALELAQRAITHPLVSRSHIRGDLHMHTNASDGRDPLHTMAGAAAALGYEYIAITDHSEHAAAARTMTLDDIERQHDAICALGERFPTFAVLHGIEADILADGSIDCPDAVLARLDIVLASLHERHGHDGRRLTERCLAAIHHPLVSIITHPSNQLVGRRPGYDMDYDRLFEAAAATGTILEIDGAPNHLDLDGDRARAAVLAGVMVSIDSDCHRADALERQMRFGLGTARRAGIMPSQVVNTRPLNELRRVLARKRSGSC
jgi:DNA polymerase (family X)